MFIAGEDKKLNLIGIVNLELWTNIGVGIASIVGGIMMGVSFIKKKYDNMKTKDENDHVIDIKCLKEQRHSNIHEMLVSLRIQMSSDRAQIVMFHNGGKFLEGSPMKRFSVSHESCFPGISMEYANLQGVLVSLFWDIVEILKQDDPKIRFTRSLPEDSSLRTYNYSKNIQAFAMLPIKKEELFIGFVRVEWNDISALPDDPDDANKLMEQYRSFIELEILRKS